MKYNMKVEYIFPKLDIDTKKYKDYEFKNYDKQIQKLPSEIIFCKKCITNNQRPRTEFDENDICNACNYAERKKKYIDWNKRKQELMELLNKHRKNNNGYDVIVPVSGGKDGATVVHKLKHEYNMHPLTITWSPFVSTDIGFQNYQNMIHSGFDGLFFYPNGFLHRKLARVAFELKGDAWEAFTFGQKAYAFHIAIKFNIPLIFYGENGEVEYGGSWKNADKPFESPEDWEELYFKGFGLKKLLQEGYKMGIFSVDEIIRNEFAFYRCPDIQKIKEMGIQMHWWSYYNFWSPNENYDYAYEHTNIRPNPKRTECSYTHFSSMDDMTDPFHWYMAFVKFGWGRATREASGDIRYGYMTRDEGLTMAKKYDSEFPREQTFHFFLEYLDITKEQFWNIVNRFKCEVK